MYASLSDAWINDSSESFANLSEISLGTTLDPFIQGSDFKPCEPSWTHIAACSRCQDKLEKLIDMKVDERLDKILLAKKLGGLDSSNKIQWKDAALLGLGSAMVILLIIIVLKQK